MNTTDLSRGLFTLTPPQSKRLIAEAVVRLPEVVHAKTNATIVVGRGTTNSYIAALLTGQPYDETTFSAGIIRNGELDVVPKGERQPALILKKGHVISDDPNNIFPDFARDDVLIKGGNALDLDGIAGVLLRSREGGTIGRSLGIIAARGSHLIMPIGLEKLIPSVPAAVEKLGLERIDYATGEKAGMMPVVGAEIITEIEALDMLAGVETTLVSAGGWGDSQGSVVLAVEGLQEEVALAKSWVEYAKGKTTIRPSI